MAWIFAGDSHPANHRAKSGARNPPRTGSQPVWIGQLRADLSTHLCGSTRAIAVLCVRCHHYLSAAGVSSGLLDCAPGSQTLAEFVGGWIRSAAVDIVVAPLLRLDHDLATNGGAQFSANQHWATRTRYSQP